MTSSIKMSPGNFKMPDRLTMRRGKYPMRNSRHINMNSVTTNAVLNGIMSSSYLSPSPHIHLRMSGMILPILRVSLSQLLVTDYKEVFCVVFFRPLGEVKRASDYNLSANNHDLVVV